MGWGVIGVEGVEEGVLHWIRVFLTRVAGRAVLAGPGRRDRELYRDMSGSYERANIHAWDTAFVAKRLYVLFQYIDGALSVA
jgi:hypothetical protein